MSVTLLRKLAIVGVVLCVAPACQKRSPSQPSDVPSSSAAAPGPAASMALTALSGSYVGMASEICDGGASVAIDDLTVDYTVSGESLAGALLLACETADCSKASPLGTITLCPLPPSPCEAGLPQAVREGSAPACLSGDPAGSGSLHVYAARPASAPASWELMAYIAESGDRSNTVFGTVDQPQDQVIPQDAPMDSARFGRRAGRMYR